MPAASSLEAGGVQSSLKKLINLVDGIAVQKKSASTYEVTKASFKILSV